MILLDTHIWFWWVQGHPRLGARHQQILQEARSWQTLAVSAISCWEVAMMIDRGRVETTLGALEWIHQALTPSGIELLPFTPEIAVESIQLPGTFHRDPADQIIVATARIHNVPLLTQDSKIVDYVHVQTF